ncbi:hypothetical protein D3C72_2183110 [compost metagenome]
MPLASRVVGPTVKTKSVYSVLSRPRLAARRQFSNGSASTSISTPLTLPSEAPAVLVMVVPGTCCWMFSCRSLMS